MQMKKLTNEYWIDRQKQFFKNLEKDEARLLKKLDMYYNREIPKIEREIASYYTKYGTDNIIEYKDLLKNIPLQDKNLLMQDMNKFFEVNPQLEHLRPIRENAYKINRLEGIEWELSKGQLELGLKEEELIHRHLTKAYEKGYKAVSRGMLGSATSIRAGTIEQLVNSKWVGGLDFSGRLWNNKEKLIDYMNTDFKNGIIRGDSYAKMNKQLRERFTKRSRADAQRLIYTEGTFVQNQAMKQPFMDMGYSHYYYDALIDDRTTDVCEGLNGERFAFIDASAGDNFPPMHSFCRSSFKIDLDTYVGGE